MDANKLLDRIKHLEDALAQANALQHRDSAPVGQDSPSLEDDTHARIVFITRLFGRNWYHRGVPIISERGLDWIASRTDQDTTILKPYLPRGGSDQSSWSFSALQVHTPIGDLWDLPDRDLVRKSFGSLSSSYFLILFPLLDEVLLAEMINAAYQSFEGVHASHAHVAARACLWAAFAVLAHLRVSEHFSATFSGEICATRAQRFLGLLNGPADLATLQTLLLLVSSSTHLYLDLLGLRSS